jgi:hypothetical protein
MANNGVLCIDNITEVDVNFNGLNIGVGSVVSAWNDTDPQAARRSCITLTGDTDEPLGSVTAITQYNSCYECLIDNYTTVSLELCSGTTYIVDLSNFGGVPTENDVFFLELTTTGETIIGCFTVTGVEQNTKEEYELLDLSVSKYLSSAPFPDCETCKNGFSAGTESTACNICWDGTGYTATVVSVPHPSYTNQFGQTVVQLDAIQLGGMNGLNN